MYLCTQFILYKKKRFMDKNTIIGLLLIMGLLVGYSIWMRPSKEVIEAKQRKQDSLALIQKEIPNDSDLITITNEAPPSATPQDENKQPNTSFENLQSQYGAFVSAAQQPENTDPVFIENDLYKITFGRKGGRIESVELKNVFTYDHKPVVLFDQNSPQNQFGFTFFSNYLELNTNDFYFVPVDIEPGKKIKVSGKDSLLFAMRLYPNATDTVIDTSRYIEYVYTIRGNNYLTGVKLRFRGMDAYLNQTQRELSFRWITQLKQQEKSYKNEKIATTIYYSDIEDVENLQESDTKTDSVVYQTGLKWISFKQHFFTSTIIADNQFTNATMVVNMDANDNEQSNTLKTLKANITFPLSNLSNE